MNKLIDEERLISFGKSIYFMDDSVDMEDHRRLLCTLENMYSDGDLRWIYKFAQEQTELAKRIKENAKGLRETLRLRQDQVAQLEQKIRVDSELFEKQVQTNKRYREALEEVKKYINSGDFYDNCWDVHVINKIILPVLEETSDD